eukprot:16437944-Heterocapsa_arctica.AAC.1
MPVGEIGVSPEGKDPVSAEVEALDVVVRRCAYPHGRSGSGLQRQALMPSPAGWVVDVVDRNLPLRQIQSG